MTTLVQGKPSLREALYALSLAKHMPDAETLDNVVCQYPQYAVELTDFAIYLTLDAIKGDAEADAAEAAADPSKVSPAVSRAISRFHNRLYAVRQEVAAAKSNEAASQSEPVDNPFAALNREQFRAFAGRIGANTVFVAKLRDRQIEPKTMTEGFKRFVADELKAPLDVLVAHFAATGGIANSKQFFKADDKPDFSQRQSFADAVRSSGLTDEQQQHLLSL